jgi:hypothetical protein
MDDHLMRVAVRLVWYVDSLESEDPPTSSSSAISPQLAGLREPP